MVTLFIRPVKQAKRSFKILKAKKQVQRESKSKRFAEAALTYHERRRERLEDYNEAKKEEMLEIELQR